MTGAPIPVGFSIPFNSLYSKCLRLRVDYVDGDKLIFVAIENVVVANSKCENPWTQGIYKADFCTRISLYK